MELTTISNQIKSLLLNMNTLNILNTITQNPHLTTDQISKKSNISIAHTYRILNKLEKHDMIKVIKQPNIKHHTYCCPINQINISFGSSIKIKVKRSE